MANPLRYFPCPACGSPLQMNSSRMMSATLREQYAVCQNPHCGAGFKICSEVSSVTSPAADLFADNIKDIRPFADKDKKALALAVEFLQRKWQAKSSQANECVKWLMQELSISTDDAILITQIAQAELNDADISINHAQSIGTNSIVIDDHQGKSNVIALAELKAFLATRDPTLL